MCIRDRANAEANKYTIHFDPNGGAGHIDDIETTYDTDVTLPDVWNADGTAAYVKYTPDGQNVTEDVIAGVIQMCIRDRDITNPSKAIFRSPFGMCFHGFPAE